MGTIYVDEIKHQSAQGSGTITIGASGETINIPSGVTLTNNGTQTGLTLSDNILFNTANKGIYLGVTTATASNLLDDYEEGTWTATFAGSTYTQTGYYTKIGNLVFVTVYGINFSVTSSVAAIISGLPFTVNNGYPAAVVSHNTYSNGGGGNAFFNNGGNSMVLMLENSTSSASTQVAGGRYVMVSGCYQTT